jgi:hypothetical protein
MLLAVLGALAACGTWAGPGQERVPAAEREVEAYLQGAVYTGNAPAHDAVEICETAATYPLLALASFRVLGSEMRGDTALVAAEVTSAATLDQHDRIADRYIITQRVRTDTLHWALLRRAGDERWHICGYSREFVDFFAPEMLYDSTVEWRPRQSSWRSIAAAVDSLRARR